VTIILHPMLSRTCPAAAQKFCAAGCGRYKCGLGPPRPAVERALRRPRGHRRLLRLGRLRMGAGRGGGPASAQIRHVPELERPRALSACVLAGAKAWAFIQMQGLSWLHRCTSPLHKYGHRTACAGHQALDNGLYRQTQPRHQVGGSPLLRIGSSSPSFAASTALQRGGLCAGRRHDLMRQDASSQ